MARVYRLGLGIVICLLCGTLALATPIVGSMDISSVFGTPVAVGMTDINFSSILGVATGSSGPFALTAVYGASVTAALGAAATGGTVYDLNAGSQPVGFSFSMIPFIIYNGANNFYLELAFINPGTNTLGTCLGAGSECTPSLGEPPFSPFNLDNQAGGSSSAVFTLKGFAYNDSDGTVGVPDAGFDGIFTAQFTNTYQSVMGEITDPSDGWVTTSWSATLKFYPIPEPSTMSFLGIGLALVGGAGVFVRRRRSQ